MAWNMVVAASETADIFTLGNDVFTEILTALFMIVCAVILGGKLRVKHDAKVASEAAVAAESADVTDNKTE